MPANWKNRTLFHGDNLGFLRAMNSGTVDLIATDPPFKKGRDFHATPDSLAHGARFQDRWSWERDVHQDWVDKITDDFPKVMHVIKGSRSSYGDDMGAFLCFMGVRLLEMRRVLKDTGSIYLHCDWTASHYLKELMDSVFGRKMFRNEIVWCYKSGGASPKRYFSKKHDVIFWYSKSSSYTFNPQREKSYNRDLKPYRFAGVNEFQDETGWYTLVGMKDYWFIDMVGRTSKERTGSPTQKPLALYGRIIESSSNEKEVVLDPFCGCATTCVAAEKLNRQWVGVDLWDKAHEVVLDRFRKEGFEAKGHAGGRLTFGQVHYTTEPPKRTDDGEIAVPFLKVKEGQQLPKESSMKRSAMYAQLLVECGRKCQGCDRTFDDPRYLELDHKQPRTDGGSNELDNRILLCGPCNRLKSNVYTLIGLRRQNKKLGYMAGSEGEHPIMKKHRESHRTAPRSLFE